MLCLVVPGVAFRVGRALVDRFGPLRSNARHRGLRLSFRRPVARARPRTRTASDALTWLTPDDGGVSARRPSDS